MKMLTIEMPDGSKWGVPVEVVARSRAAHYAHEFDGDVERSMAEDTMPLFESDDYEVKDWAANNMNWSDVKDHATLASLPEDSEASHQEGWINGEYEIIDKPDGGSADLLNLERLASIPLKAITRSLREIQTDVDEPTAMLRSDELANPVFASADAKEGMRAFKEKRKANFTGK